MRRWVKVKQVAGWVRDILIGAAILFVVLTLAGLAGAKLLAAVGVHLVPTFDPDKFEPAEFAWLFGHGVGLLLTVFVIGLAASWLRAIYVAARDA